MDSIVYTPVRVSEGVIDGAPAARFTARLEELIESGYGLCESEAEHEGSLPGEAGRPAEQSTIPCSGKR